MKKDDIFNWLSPSLGPIAFGIIVYLFFGFDRSNQTMLVGSVLFILMGVISGVLFLVNPKKIKSVKLSVVYFGILCLTFGIIIFP